MSQSSQPSHLLKGSRAIALTIKNIQPAVVAVYPITPQTHIVEDLALFKAKNEADYEYILTESEFAAASIVEGASAAGVRVYTATSSQGLLLMTEVLFNIAGMRFPVVLTCANRGVSAPITIWNDHQDAMTVRDAGWIMFFAENHQEAVQQHIMAYKIAEQLNLPVMVNVDGFTLTHTYEPISIPSKKQIKKYLPNYKPKPRTFLDPKHPITMGAFVTPAHYMEIRQSLHDDLVNSQKIINHEFFAYHKIILKSKFLNLKSKINNGLIEYYGSKNPDIILIAMGSVVGTIKDVVDEINQITNQKPFATNNSSIFNNSVKTEKSKNGKINNQLGVLKIKTYRPFPENEILDIIKKTKYVAVLDKAISLGHIGPLAADIKSIAQGKIKVKIQNFIIGLGGRDITCKMIKKIIKEVQKREDQIQFIG